MAGSNYQAFIRYIICLLGVKDERGILREGRQETRRGGRLVGGGAFGLWFLAI